MLKMKKVFSKSNAVGFLALVVGVAMLAALSGCAPSMKSITEDGKYSPVETADGLVLGTENAATNTVSWKGIPYAKAPVGDLRWKKPQPLDKRAEPLKTEMFGKICPQYIDHDMNPATPQTIVGDEDCLTLNIWAPKGGAADLPVFFWIHGGGNSIQWPLLSRLDGGILADKGKMIVVTFNYRLGPMGFWNHPVLKTGNAEADSGNFALLDMMAALKWVQANIRNFGGNPGNVTIAGESAGGQNVFALLTSPMAKGLFSKAISQSGVVRHFSPEVGAAHVNSILVKMMVADQTAADEKAAAEKLKSLSAKEINAYMRSKSAAAFLSAYPEGPAAGMIRIPTCFIDGTVLPLDFYQAFQTGQYNKVPTLLGTNKEETKLFVRSLPLFDGWRKDGSLFKDPAKIEFYDLVNKYQSDGWKVMAVDYPARLLRDNPGQPFVYAYQFLWGAGGFKNNVMNPPLNFILGACHAMEIDFVFGTEKASLGAVVFNEKNKPGRVALSNAMMDYWSTFARTGNPNRQGSGLPKWSPWSNISVFPKTLLLDADLENAKISMSRSELTQEAVEAALKEEARYNELKPFWDGSPYRRH